MATVFNSFYEAVMEKVHNLGSDTLKVMLTNSAPVVTNTVKTDITEISAGNGYTTGGITLTTTSSSQTSGVYKLVLANDDITASGGSIGPFRYAVLYNDTASNDELICFMDYGSSITLADGEKLNINFDQSEGALKLNVAA